MHYEYVYGRNPAQTGREVLHIKASSYCVPDTCTPLAIVIQRLSIGHGIASHQTGCPELDEGPEHKDPCEFSQTHRGLLVVLIRKTGAVYGIIASWSSPSFSITSGIKSSLDTPSDKAIELAT